MAVVSFDAQEFVKRLKRAGFTELQAEAVTEAQRDSLAQVLEGQVVTKADFLKLELKLIEHQGKRI